MGGDVRAILETATERQHILIQNMKNAVGRISVNTPKKPIKQPNPKRFTLQLKTG